MQFSVGQEEKGEKGPKKTQKLRPVNRPKPMILACFDVDLRRGVPLFQS